MLTGVRKDRSGARRVRMGWRTILADNRSAAILREASKVQMALVGQ